MKTTKTLMSLSALFLLGLVAFSAVGCEDGPAEEAGEEIDNAADDAADAMD